ncbi:hypothetical protein DFH29DRAFT_1010861 [Suillus ampliporus]|nr:hypothetical protein DFH29DRAFT_1010861 [Suillus ampliporus]
MVGLGASLLLKIKDALAGRAEHKMAFEEFDTAITPDHHSAWLAEMEVWEDNPNNMTIPNPLKAKATSITQASARLKLAELEAKELQRGIDTSLHPEISPSVLIAAGIDLEEEQCRLTIAVESLGLHATDTQKSSIVQMRNSLRHKIDTWRRAQVLYLPAVQSIINHAASLGKKDWQGRLQELADDDIKPLVDPFTIGEGRRQVSWIWMMDGVDCSDEGDNDGVRIEWCKSRARALRWSEEVELLREEMRRVLQFFAWQAA